MRVAEMTSSFIPLRTGAQQPLHSSGCQSGGAFGETGARNREDEQEVGSADGD
jgi:hypothetical protein